MSTSLDLSRPGLPIDARRVGQRETQDSSLDRLRALKEADTVYANYLCLIQRKISNRVMIHMKFHTQNTCEYWTSNPHIRGSWRGSCPSLVLWC